MASNEYMKAIIPVAGIGMHLRPHTHTQPKPLLPVAGKPILGHIIDNLLDAGIEDLIFVVGYLKEKIEEYVQQSYADKTNIHFVIQEPRRGVGHAVWMCRNLVNKGEELIVILGDTIFDEDTAGIIKAKGSILAVHEVANPREFGIVVLDRAGVVTEVIEKPQIPKSNLALVGMYKISESDILFEVLDDLIDQPMIREDEYSLTDAIMQMIRKKIPFSTHRVEKWFDCGRRQSLLDANRTLLEQNPMSLNDQFKGSVIIPPVQIADHCTIQHSIIGPYVTIAEHTVIQNSTVKNSIIGAYAKLDTIVLQDSIVGNDTFLRGKATSVNIGDNTEIDFDQ